MSSSTIAWASSVPADLAYRFEAKSPSGSSIITKASTEIAQIVNNDRSNRLAIYPSILVHHRTVLDKLSFSYYTLLFVDVVVDFAGYYSPVVLK